MRARLYVTRKSNTLSNKVMDDTTFTADSPDALVQAQREWSETYRVLAASDRRFGSTALRRRLLLLSTRILRLRRQCDGAVQEVRAREG